MAAQQNLFKKAHQIRKRNPGMSMKDACALAQGKKPGTVKKAAPKKAAVGKKPAAAKKKAPSSPLIRQGAPVKKYPVKVIKKKSMVKRFSIGAIPASRVALDKLNAELRHLRNFEDRVEKGKAQLKIEKNPADKRATSKAIDYYKDLIAITKQNITNLKRQIR